MNVYKAADGTWHVRISFAGSEHELRQHYFTEQSALSAGSTAISHAVMDALTHRQAS